MGVPQTILTTPTDILESQVTPSGMAFLFLVLLVLLYLQVRNVCDCIKVALDFVSPEVSHVIIMSIVVIYCTVYMTQNKTWQLPGQNRDILVCFNRVLFMRCAIHGEKA